jgi:hypothetical protein
LQRHQQRIGSGHRIERQQAQRGRTIDEADVIAAIMPGQRLAQPIGAALHRNQLHLRARQVHRGGQQIEAGNGGGHGAFRQRRLAHQQIVGGIFARGSPHAHAGGSVALRIKVDQQGAPSGGGKGGGQIDRGGGFAHSALLVGNGNADHGVTPF